MLNKAAVALITILALNTTSAIAATATPDTERVQQLIDQLGTFGANPEGGVSRPGFGEADKAARAWVIEELRRLGLDIRIDAAANIIARRAGSEDSLPAIAFGSHIDSVPNGGNYDGQAGVVAALQVMDRLQRDNITTRHPLELLIFVAEEDGLFGSAAMTGVLQKSELSFVTNSGRTAGAGMDFLGGDSDAIDTAVRGDDELAAFIELHIEQGPFLDRKGLDIGVVEGIVGISEWDIQVSGTANHAGTTPMDARRDALLAASQLVIAVNNSVNKVGGRLVGTVGEFDVHPGVSNIVPGSVNMVLEMRDLDQAQIDNGFALTKRRAQRIAAGGNVEITITPSLRHTAALTDRNIANLIQAASDGLGYSSLAMPSGAGHDAQNMATRWPTGMIFVPSKDGVSHSPHEYTSAEALARGAAVLYEAVLLLDAR